MGLEDKVIIINREKKIDHRGWFLKTIDGKEKFNPFHCEVYFTVAKPGECKGGHYHREAKEWFTLITGKAELKLVDVISKEKKIILLDQNDPVTIFVPPFIAHKFKNISITEDFILVAFTDKHFDPMDTIQYNIFT